MSFFFYLGSWSFLLASEEGEEGNVGDLDYLETDTGDITNGVTRTTKSSDEDFVVFFDVIQTTVIWDECGNFFAIFDQLNSDAFTNSGVRLFSFDADFLENNSLRMG